MVRFIGSRKNLTEDKLDELEEMVMDSTKAQAILEAAKMSMGECVCTALRSPLTVTHCHFGLYRSVS